MKKNLIKKCAVAAAACAVMAAGVGYYYFFSSMSKDGETHYVYVDDDDNIDSVYTKPHQRHKLRLACAHRTLRHRAVNRSLADVPPHEKRAADTC